MATNAALAATAALIGDPARAAMLAALLDGRALSAGELAEAAGITPQTASGHLARLAEAGLLAVARQGRHRYHRLAAPAVARVLEGLLDLAAAAPRRVATGPRDAAMRLARTCYDHLAGQVAVAIADSLTDRSFIELGPDAGAVTPAGEAFLAGLGVAPASARGGLSPASARGGLSPAPARGRLFCRPCLDWSERRPHVAGVLGAALCTRCLELGWVRRRAGSRSLEVTPAGWRGLREAFGVEEAALKPSPPG